MGSGAVSSVQKGSFAVSRDVKIIGLVLILIAVGFSSVSAIEPAELSGLIKSRDGKPLAGVKVFTYAPEKGKIEPLGLQTAARLYETESDPQGFFKLPSHGRVVHFRGKDLRPLTKILDLAVTRIDVTMEDGATSLWKIPACSALLDRQERVGIGFRVVVPANVMVKKDDGRFEDGGYFFGYDNHAQIETMINWWESTSLEPSEKYLLDSKEFSQRMWSSGSKWGLEFRGVKTDGKLWRWISLRNGAITYQGNQRQSAEVFDVMIDNMCFDESAVNGD